MYGTFLFSVCARQALGPTLGPTLGPKEPSIQRVAGAVPAGVSRPRRETDHLIYSSTKANNFRISVGLNPTALSFVSWPTPVPIDRLFYNVLYWFFPKFLLYNACCILRNSGIFCKINIYPDCWNSR